MAHPNFEYSPGILYIQISEINEFKFKIKK